MRQDNLKKKYTEWKNKTQNSMIPFPRNIKTGKMTDSMAKEIRWAVVFEMRWGFTGEENFPGWQKCFIYW